MSFSCVLIGQGPQLVACGDHLLRRQHQVRCVVSDCPDAIAWAQRHGLRWVPADEPIATLRREPFDWLFSIVNHAVTPPELLALPMRGAVNYHDSLLPSYGGFHATTWAILDGQREHGITWHRMTEQVDAGPYLLQRQFSIAEDDTAFSLAARASELAVRSFEELLDAIERERVTEMPALPVREFRRKSERPAPGVFDGRQSVSATLRNLRAFDFGPEDNWLLRCKLATPNGALLTIGSAARSATVAGANPPGTVLAIVGDSVEVVFSDGVLRCSELATLAGAPVDAAQFAQQGLVVGARLPDCAVMAAAAAALDSSVTRSERYWVRKLGAFVPARLGEIRDNAAPLPSRELRLTLPVALASLPPKAQQAALLAAFAGYVARVGEDVARVDLNLIVDNVPEGLSGLYATQLPLSLATAMATPWSQLALAAEQELEAAARHCTYASDVWSRYALLRGRSVSERTSALAIACGSVPAVLPVATKLLLAIAPGGHDLVLRYDPAALPPVAAERIGNRLVHLLAAVSGGVDLPLFEWPLLTNEERELLLHTFQATERPDVPMACIHTLFAARVAAVPDRVALAYREESITYRALAQRVRGLAAHLRELGVGPDRLVGIAMERSIDMVVGLLAILEAGGAYVPIDPVYPSERIAVMLEDSGARWLVTESKVVPRLPRHNAEVVFVDASRVSPDIETPALPPLAQRPENLAYVIFTSGSTGRPKGVMVEHRNVANFFAGMDARLGSEPGTWLAVTSISFDISVLELLWPLTRGFEVVIQEEGDKATLRKAHAQVASSVPMGFGLFYFAADSTEAAKRNAYRLLLDGARFADTHEFTAVWTPERHFHAFGGLYPNAALTSAAIATITKNVQLRAGSVVIPLHDPIRVAEEWAVVDNLSQGRVGLSFASGWHANDFALKPENYERRREVMQEHITTVLRLWAGEKVSVKNGLGQQIEVSVLPRPVNQTPPMWIASAGNVETFRMTGRLGYNVLTNMLGQDLADLKVKFAAYREARREAGHAGDGIISVMLHTFVTTTDERARELARGPFGNYLTTSYDLVKVAPWMFPAFKQPSVVAAGGANAAFDMSRFDADDMAALLDHAFDRYFDTAGLFGTPERALRLVEQLKEIGANEVACLVDFGIDPDIVLENLVHLDELRRLANPAPSSVELAPRAPVTIGEQFRRRPITHFQCTPSMARILLADGTLRTMQSLRTFLVGGEALPPDLAAAIRRELPGVALHNMYGPTETTVWSTTARVDGTEAGDITIGTPIANTQVRLLDARGQLVPLGAPGELCIGGLGVTRGYWARPELTAERFVVDPFLAGNRLYRTGDLARFRDDGAIEYLGRIDQQVKVNGYRIELGEIEAVLSRHHAVEQAVVAVKERSGQQQLVGYVVAAGGRNDGAGSGANDKRAATARWQERWDSAYAQRTGAESAARRRDTSGWLSSYTGEPIVPEVMDEWVEQTLQRILALRPRRVLEIGCGTGMLLYVCLPHVEHYTAVDVSAVALESIRAELSAEERARVTLLQRSADDLGDFEPGSFDLVVVNSVAQYFPSADYLTAVLDRTSTLLVDGGAIFLGDLRCLEELATFHTLVELHKAPSQTPASTLVSRLEERLRHDTELVLARGYFDALRTKVTRLGVESFRCKSGRHASEMRDFRCDVVLRAGVRLPQLDLSTIPVLQGPRSMHEIEQALRTRPSLLCVTGVLNARLDRVVAAMERMRRPDEAVTAEVLLAACGEQPLGIDPDRIGSLDSEYDAEIRFGERPGTFDALLRRRGHANAGSWPVAVVPGSPIASTPWLHSGAVDIAPQLRAHLLEFLPEFMVPAVFVVLPALPLTPNGKVDRKRLPVPTEGKRAAAAEFVLPVNELERTIAGIWQQVLGIESVGRKDNIFDLGASSLLTVEANHRLQQVLERKIPLVTMFRHPTIEALARHLAPAAAAGDTNDAVAAAKAEEERQARLAAATARRRQARARGN